MKDLIEESISILNNGDDISGLASFSMSLAGQKDPELGHLQSFGRALRVRPGRRRPRRQAGRAGGAVSFCSLFSFQTEDVRERLNRLIHVPFKIEFSGSQIIFFDSEETIGRGKGPGRSADQPF